jgi:hypothetical protein
MDVEDAELLILQGAERSIRKVMQAIIEVHFSKVGSGKVDLFLVNGGFTVKRRASGQGTPLGFTSLAQACGND